MGIVTLRANGKNQKWIVLQRSAEHHSTTAFLSSKVGIRGLLEYLRKENAKYVVLRFYEKLPELYREGGDLDILIADEDEEKLREFIRKHPGTISVDIASVSSSAYGGIPYYPPPLARKILDSAIEGPGGSRVPGPKEKFLSFAYHVLYHTGPAAGVPSSLPYVDVNRHPENDYAGMLAKMAEELGININTDMESLDDYLFKEGWRPMRDTLAIISSWNEWVRERFFSAQPVKEIGLGVFVVRKKLLEIGLFESVLGEIKKDNFTVIVSKVFDEDGQKRALLSLRGGNWAEKIDLDRDKSLVPAAAVVALDLYAAHSKNNSSSHDGYGRLRALKEKLRKRFDDRGISLIHSTDNTHEAWEYVEVCFPGGVDEVKEEIDELYRGFRLPVAERVKFYLKALPYYKKRAIFRARRSLVRYLENI